MQLVAWFEFPVWLFSAGYNKTSLWNDYKNEMSSFTDISSQIGLVKDKSLS